MSNIWPSYEAAGPCASGPQPGARALMSWSLEWPNSGSGGIYNCRLVSGTSTRSVHGEGRAIDVMFPVRNGLAHDSGTALVNALLPHVGSLGIQCIIWNRRIWSRSSPNGTRYNGKHAHTDHIHIELIRSASRSLTVEKIRSILNTMSPPAIEPKPKPNPDPEPIKYEDEDEDMTICFRLGSTEEYWVVAGVFRYPTTKDVYDLHVYASHAEGRMRHKVMGREQFTKLVVAATQRADHMYLAYHNTNQIAKATGVPRGTYK